MTFETPAVDMPLIAGIMTGLALVGILVIYLVKRWQDAQDEKMVMRLRERFGDWH